MPRRRSRPLGERGVAANALDVRAHGASAPDMGESHATTATTPCRGSSGTEAGCERCRCARGRPLWSTGELHAGNAKAGVKPHCGERRGQDAEAGPAAEQEREPLGAAGT